MHLGAVAALQGATAQCAVRDTHVACRTVAHGNITQHTVRDLCLSEITSNELAVLEGNTTDLLVCEININEMTVFEAHWVVLVLRTCKLGKDVIAVVGGVDGWCWCWWLCWCLGFLRHGCGSFCAWWQLVVFCSFQRCGSPPALPVVCVFCDKYIKQCAVCVVVLFMWLTCDDGGIIRFQLIKETIGSLLNFRFYILTMGVECQSGWL